MTTVNLKSSVRPSSEPFESTDSGDDEDFVSVIRQAEIAIENGVFPERIYQGSSGSYFVKNSYEKKIGVFKPKDEEPYGSMNPKWIKWMQKSCSPCCFGRSCLIPNQGYLSEAAAYIIDEKLGLGVVPKTRVVRLVSKTFNYSTLDRAKARTKRNVSERFPKMGKRFNRIGLPRKVGSFQMYCEGYEDACTWLKKNPLDSFPEAAQDHFQKQFERLVCLDYIIRNTDRGADNWLIKLVPVSPRNQVESDEDEPPLPPLSYEIRIAAIDNGLSFPFKHPDAWRTYPYQWAWISPANNPFSHEIRDILLPKLADMNFVQEICDALHALFKSDRNFDKHHFEKQMSVMRGQILNLCQALRDLKTPEQLVTMPAVVIERKNSVGKGKRHHSTT